LIELLNKMLPEYTLSICYYKAKKMLYMLDGHGV